MQYTLTVAVCATVPRKSVPVAGVDYSYDENPDEFGFDDGQDQERDLQVLSRHVHVSIDLLANPRRSRGRRRRRR